jgi:N-acylglucosamine-6-phosphate 2-epimerase
LAGSLAATTPSTAAPLQRLRGGLVVSCQAPPDHPLHGPGHMAAMARAAVAGGAAGIRAESPADVAAVAAGVEVPVIGLRKVRTPGQAVYLTPTVADAEAVAAAGAHVVAVDATDRPRGAHPDGASLVAAVVASIGVPVLADVDELGAGLRARAAGAAAVATTLAGLTEPGAPVPDGPDVELVAALAAELDCPVIAEGRYATPEHVRAAFAAGAWAVCAGAAITDPVALTRRLAGAVA